MVVSLRPRCQTPTEGGRSPGRAGSIPWTSSSSRVCAQRNVKRRGQAQQNSHARKDDGRLAATPTASHGGLSPLRSTSTVPAGPRRGRAGEAGHRASGEPPKRRSVEPNSEAAPRRHPSLGPTSIVAVGGRALRASTSASTYKPVIGLTAEVARARTPARRSEPRPTTRRTVVRPTGPSRCPAEPF
jgi:hypothetical protein